MCVTHWQYVLHGDDKDIVANQTVPVHKDGFDWLEQQVSAHQQEVETGDQVTQTEHADPERWYQWWFHCVYFTALQFYFFWEFRSKNIYLPLKPFGGSFLDKVELKLYPKMQCSGTHYYREDVNMNSRYLISLGTYSHIHTATAMGSWEFIFTALR